MKEEGIYFHQPSGQSSLDRARGVPEQWLAEVRGLGFAEAAITTAEPFPEQAAELERFLAEGRHGGMHYLAERNAAGQLVRADPRSALPEAHSVLVVTLPYPSPRWVSLRTSRDGASVQGQIRGHIGAYAGGRDYHHVLKERLLVAADILADLLHTPVLARACVDTALVSERQLAERAGLVFLGKNTLGISPGSGSTFHLGVLLVDAELPSVRGSAPAEGCGRCQACLDACPTGALDGPHRIDARRCVSYLTIEQDGVIPRELRRGIGTRVFGCDACQSVCPYNQSSSLPEPDPELEPSDFWLESDLSRLLGMSASEYRRQVRRTALQRVTRTELARNAAVALGNAGSPSAIAWLARVLDGPAPKLVQVHAAWALGELWLTHGHAAAREALVQHAGHPEPEVASEVLAAIGPPPPNCPPLGHPPPGRPSE